MKLKDKLIGFVFGAAIASVATVWAVTGQNGFLDLTGSPMLMATGGSDLRLGTSDETAPGKVDILVDGAAAWSFTTGTGFVGTGTGDIGWTVNAGANTACSSTCTTPCVFGVNTASATADIVDCADATADECLCAGAS